MTRKNGRITIIGSNYIRYGLVPDLFEKSFKIYCKRNFAKKNFQVHNLENTYATAGIILTVLGIEAYRNRICFFEKRKVHSVAKDIALMFQSKKAGFLKQNFEEVLSEVFVIRDVIVHNHIYEVNAIFDDKEEILSYSQKLLKGYGEDKKFKNFVDAKTGRTIRLFLNVQPAKIGFEDLFIVLVLFDLFVGISNELLPNYYVPFNCVYTLEKKFIDSLSKYLSYFYNQLPSKKFHSKLRKLLLYLKTTFEHYLPSSYDCFLNNCCPRCGEFGFQQFKDIYNCKKCNFKFD